jgi:hypothetical protein
MSIFAQYVVSGTPVENGDWVLVPVSLQAGSQPSPAVGDRLRVAFTQDGPITSVSAGYGLVGGGSAGAITLSADTAVLASKQDLAGLASKQDLAGKASTTHKSTHAAGGSDALSPSDIGAAPAASPAITGNATFTASSGVPVTITNTGAGDSFVVRDAASDTTPFLVDAGGQVAIQRSSATAPLTFSNDVAAAATPSQSEQTNKIRLYDDGTFQFGFGVSASSINIAANGGNAAAIRFWTDSAERMRIGGTGNVGIGRIAPSSALDVNGVITVAAGTASAPAIVASGDSDTGILFPAANVIAVSTGGSEQLRVNAAGNLMVGAPASWDAGQTAQAAIEVRRSSATVYSGTGSSLGGAAAAAITVRNVSSTAGSWAALVLQGQRGDGEIQAVSIGAVTHNDSLYQPHLVFTHRSSSGGQTERMRIASGGNVGIATQTPESRLHVAGVITVSAGTAALPALVPSGDANTGILFPAADVVAISTGGVERLRVSAEGRIGVGTTAPTQLLDVRGTLRADALTDGTTTRTMAAVLAGQGGALSSLSDVTVSLDYPAADNRFLQYKTSLGKWVPSGDGGLISVGSLPLGGQWPQQTIGWYVDQRAPKASPAFTGAATIATSSGVPLTITNAGVGNSLVVNKTSGGTPTLVVDADGRVGVGVTAPASQLHVSGAIRATSLTDGTTTKSMSELLSGTGGTAGRATHIDQKLTPTSSTAGTAGQLYWDDNFIYVRTAVGWKRAQLWGLTDTPATGYEQVKLTQAQYDALAVKDPNTLYVIVP